MARKNKKSKGRGWHGDPYGHSLASRGYKLKSKGILGTIKEGAKKAGEKVKSGVEKLKESSKSGILSDVKEKAKSGYEKLKSHLADEEDEEIAKTVESDLRKSMDESIQSQNGGEIDDFHPDYTEEQLQDLVENGTPRELYDAVKSGEIIDADGVEISDENQQELARHLGDLKHDWKMAEQYKEETEREVEEMERYLKEQYEIREDEINEQWDELSDNQQTDEMHNELEHDLESYENDLKSQLAEYHAEYEMMVDVEDALGEVYETRKKFVDELIE